MKFSLNFLFLLLYLAVGFIPNFSAIDRIATHFIYINLINLFSIYYFYNKKAKIDFIELVFTNKPLVLYILFWVWALLSILYSINVNESLISVSRLFTFILATCMIGLHFSCLKSLKSVFIFILFPIILLEIFIPTYVFLDIISNVEFSFKYSDSLKTFTPNKNITAAIIAAHLGFFFSLKFYLKKLEWLFLFLFFVGSGILFFISSRASIIGLSLSLTLLYILTFIKKRENLAYLSKVCLSVIFGFLVSNFYIGSDSNVSIKNRISSVSTEDYSTNERIRFYKHGLSHIKNNPLIGVGIGNWKQKSIEYDALNIKQYIVPYSLHNDFLQYGTETGIIGMFLYLMIFLSILLINIRRIDTNYFLSASLIISISVLFIDSNLNFPHQRPIMMILLALIISLTELNRTKEVEK